MRVTFHLRAPQANEVLVRGVLPPPLAMQKDAEGIWSATTDGLKRDGYAYSFVVNGLVIADPANVKFRPAYKNFNQSVLLVPGPNAWTPVAAVPRGGVSRHVFNPRLGGGLLGAGQCRGRCTPGSEASGSAERAALY
jgi:enterochelin esterase family protein